MRKVSQFSFVLVLLLAAVSGVSAQDDMMMSGPDVIVTLEPTPFAEGAGLAGVTGWAHVVSDEGHVRIALEPNGAELPEGSVLEGWVVDAGLDGGPGMTNVTDDDEAYGVSFGDEGFDAAVEAAPYALSTGVLTVTEEGTWEVVFDIPAYNFSPYDAVVVTLESDGDNAMGFDPRPGTPMFAGAIADGVPSDEVMMGDDMGGDEEMMGDEESMGDEEEMMDDEESMGDDDMMMAEGIEITFETTPFTEGAGIADAIVTSLVYVEDGLIEITIDLNGAQLPEGTVLEGWVVDAGLNGGPGTTNVTDDDEAYGVSFGDANFDTLVESSPYALSTGVAYDSMMDGTLSLHFHVPAYNFSPYDAVVITLESDGNTTDGFDPRPGAPVFIGAIEDMMGM